MVSSIFRDAGLEDAEVEMGKVTLIEAHGHKILHKMKKALALKHAGYCCMTFVECEGTGQYSDHEKEHISDKYPFAEAYRVIKLEMLVENKHVKSVVEIIRKSGHTGYHGDGKIAISPVEEEYKVRNR